MIARVVAMLLAQSSPARAAEGTAQLGTSQVLRASLTAIHVDILDSATETVVWQGTSLDAARVPVPVGADVYDPAGGFVGRFASGDPIPPVAGNGAYLFLVGDDLTGSAACCDASDPLFDPVCCATPDGVVEDILEWDVAVSGASVGRGRVWSDTWWFDGGTYSSAGALDGRFYFRVGGGGPSNDGVIELEVDGLAGFLYSVAGNASGLDGTHGRSVADVGQPFAEEHRVYLLPPEDADMDALPAALRSAAAGYEDPACPVAAPGIPWFGASFTLDSVTAGTTHLVCDLDGDGVFSYTSDRDAHRIADADVGVNEILWDGLDNAGNPAPSGPTTCLVQVAVGELHYPARDVEAAYEGLRTWAVDASLIRTGLPMFWNDGAVQFLEEQLMPSGELSAVEAPVGGLFPGAYGDPPIAHSADAPGNARGWGDFVGDDTKGNQTYLDTWAFLSIATVGGLVVEVVDALADSDGDGVDDLTETCGLGTDPLDPDTDGDGLLDGEEALLGTDALSADTDLDGYGDLLETGDPLAPIDTDGDGLADAVDLDDDDDGVATVDELDADTDGDGLADRQDDDDDNDGIPTADEIAASGGAEVQSPDNDGLPAWLDADSDDDSLPDATEGLADTDGDGVVDLLDLDDDGDLVSTLDELTIWVSLGADPSNPDDDGDGLIGERDADPDADNIPSFLDDDSDGDGIADAVEGFADPDGDSVGAFEDLDADGDLVDDAVEGEATDTDLDQTPDRLDLDDDGDGVDTFDERGDTDEDGLPDRLDLDDDGDGLLTADELADSERIFDVDPDGDGQATWVDEDADGDGVPDGEEGRESDSDRDGVPDYLDPDVLSAWFKGGGACSGTGAAPVGGGFASLLALGLVRRRGAAVLVGLGLAGAAAAKDGAEISATRGSAKGTLVLWPRVVTQEPAILPLARVLQDRLQTVVARVGPAALVRVRPEPERACPLQGCRGVSVGVLLGAEGGGCVAVAWVGAPAGGPVTLVPWAGSVELSRGEIGFREPPESVVTVREYVPCDGLSDHLQDAALEEALRSHAGLAAGRR